MTHMLAIILVPADVTEEQASKMVMDLMYPYASYFPSEFTPDDFYYVPCYCDPAREHGIEMADKKVGEFWQLYQPYTALPEKQRPKWRDYNPVVEWQKEAIENTRSHLSHQVDPSCQHCKGTGIMETGSNFSLVKLEGWDIDGDFDVVFDSPNVCHVDELSEEIDYEAVITPDGRWHERESWEQTWEDWEQKARVLLQQHQEYLAIKCHVNQ